MTGDRECGTAQQLLSCVHTLNLRLPSGPRDAPSIFNLEERFRSHTLAPSAPRRCHQMFFPEYAKLSRVPRNTKASYALDLSCTIPMAPTIEGTPAPTAGTRYPCGFLTRPQGSEPAPQECCCPPPAQTGSNMARLEPLHLPRWQGAKTDALGRPGGRLSQQRYGHQGEGREPWQGQRAPDPSLGGRPSPRRNPGVD